MDNLESFSNHTLKRSSKRISHQLGFLLTFLIKCSVLRSKGQWKSCYLILNTNFNYYLNKILEKEFKWYKLQNNSKNWLKKPVIHYLRRKLIDIRRIYHHWNTFSNFIKIWLMIYAILNSSKDRIIWKLRIRFTNIRK